MILLSKNSAFTLQKDCFYTPKAMLFASGLNCKQKEIIALFIQKKIDFYRI